MPTRPPELQAEVNKIQARLLEAKEKAGALAAEFAVLSGDMEALSEEMSA